MPSVEEYVVFLPVLCGNRQSMAVYIARRKVMLKTASLAAALLLGASSFALAQTSSTTTTPAPTTGAGTTGTGMTGSTTKGASGSSMMSESQVKQELERQGYSGIKLHEDTATSEKGDWTGTAMKGGKEVNIHVDPSGKVTQR
jgi:hypothetical protein